MRRWPRRAGSSGGRGTCRRGVMVYLLLVACLFPELGYPDVWRKLTAGLGWLPQAVPSAGALAPARRRVGPEPLRFLFGLLPGRGPSRLRGVVALLVCATDGTIVSVPGSPANLAWYRKGGSFNGGTGCPQARLLAPASGGPSAAACPTDSGAVGPPRGHCGGGAGEHRLTLWRWRNVLTGADLIAAVTGRGKHITAAGTGSWRS